MDERALSGCLLNAPAPERNDPMSLPSTCDLCDARRDDPALRVLPPVFQAYGSRLAFAGPVSTLQCFEDNTLVRSALETPGQGRVLVIDGGASTRTALVGGKLAELAARNGWAGLVVDGCVRDRDEIAACDVGVRALGLCPIPPAKRGAGQRDVPVRVQGVPVRPGDWLLADADGVVLLDRAP
jgi:regulator of ribonuclease activity A